MYVWIERPLSYPIPNPSWGIHLETSLSFIYIRLPRANLIPIFRYFVFFVPSSLLHPNSSSMDLPSQFLLFCLPPALFLFYSASAFCLYLYIHIYWLQSLFSHSLVYSWYDWAFGSIATQSIQANKNNSLLKRFFTLIKKFSKSKESSFFNFVVCLGHIFYSNLRLVRPACLYPV